MTAHAVIEKSRQVTPVGKRKPYGLARRSDLPGSDANLDLNTLGGRLAWARLREEITQEDLAMAIDKVRATIVAYERGSIMPPINVVEELAKRLKVSPSYLAFGEHGIKSRAGANAAEMTVNIDEITYGRDGSYVSGTFAMPRRLADSYVDNVDKLKVIVLNHHADAFGLRAGDRLFVDSSIQSIDKDFDTYVIEVDGGMEVVRIAPSFTKTNMTLVEGPRGDKVQTNPADLQIVGAVVSTLRSA